VNNSLENVTDYFKPFLLSSIILKTDKKVLKRGRLKIFQVKQHYIRLYLDVNGVEKMYELPYPFAVEPGENTLTLNYHLTCIMKTQDLEIQTKLLDTNNKSKLYDNLVYMLISSENEL